MGMRLPDRSGGNLSEVLNIAAVPFQRDTVDTCHTHTHKHLPTMLNFHFTLPPTLFLWLQTSQLFSSSSQTSKQKRRSKNEGMLCQEKWTDPVSISLFDNLTPCIMQRYLATIQKETYCRHTVHAIPFQTHKCQSKSLIQMLTNGVFPLLKKERWLIASSEQITSNIPHKTVTSKEITVTSKQGRFPQKLQGSEVFSKLISTYV